MDASAAPASPVGGAPATAAYRPPDRVTAASTGYRECMSEPRREPTREDYAKGLPDHHDPTAGVLGAAPAQSALTLRLVLAAFGLVVCVVSGVLLLRTELPTWPAVLLLVLGAVALVDLVVVARRKLRGEPG